jgi:RimJ/RimL family protein N-acetyltransferase
VPRSLAQFEAGFDQELTKDHNDRAWVRGRYEDELVMAILREDWTPRA